VIKKEKNELNLPVIENEPLPSSIRSIDEINEWIEQDYKYFFNRKIYERDKKRNVVTVPFKV
jgi:hypothetical protein